MIEWKRMDEPLRYYSESVDDEVELTTIPQMLEAIPEVVKRGDDGQAHEIEDALHRLSFRSILSAETLKEAREIAKQALSTTEIQFGRWFE